MQRVDAQAVKAPRSGLVLLIAAPTITDPSLRWLGGFTWQPEVRDGSDAIGIECDGGNAARTPADQPGIESFVPFLVWAAEKCSTKDKTRDWLGRARRALESEQSFLVAGELWDGTIGNALGNQSLASADADVLTTTAVPGGVALTMVDSALSRRLRNRQGMVHCRPEMVDVWTAAYLLRFESGSAFTPNGHLVVADAGYTGAGPRETPDDAPVAATVDSHWVYGTDVISTRLGTPETMPDAATSPESVDRTRNDQVVWAQRMIGLEWDHQAHLAVEVAQGALA